MDDGRTAPSDFEALDQERREQDNAGSDREIKELDDLEEPHFQPSALDQHLEEEPQEGQEQLPLSKEQQMEEHRLEEREAQLREEHRHLQELEQQEEQMRVERDREEQMHLREKALEQENLEERQEQLRLQLELQTVEHESNEDGGPAGASENERLELDILEQDRQQQGLDSVKHEQTGDHAHTGELLRETRTAYASQMHCSSPESARLEQPEVTGSVREEPDADTEDEDEDWNEASRIVDEISSQVTEILAAAKTASKQEKMALFAQKRSLESSPAYADALRYLEDPASERARRDQDDAQASAVVEAVSAKIAEVLAATRGASKKDKPALLARKRELENSEEYLTALRYLEDPTGERLRRLAKANQADSS